MFKQKTSWLLASSSPRRIEFFSRYNFKFTTLAPEIDETPQASESALDYALRIAEQKAKTAAKITENQRVIIAADTIIDLDGRIVGKPQNKDAALNCLLSLNGRTHQVRTAVHVVIAGQRALIFNCCSAVEFFQHPTKVIEAYAFSGEGLDKSGAYSIEGLGSFLIKSVTGSWNSVVGFPMELFIYKAWQKELITLT